MPYLYMLRENDITFEAAFKDLEGFLSEKNGATVFHLSTNFTRLGAHKVYQTLKNTGIYRELDNGIFITFESLLNPETQDVVFKGAKCCKFLMIECQNKDRDRNKMNNLLKNFNDFFKDNSSN